MKAILRLGVLLGILSLGLGAMADEVRTIRVQFERGTSGATIHSHVTGGETVRYVVNAREGQVLHVSFEPARPNASFNVFLPGTVPGRDAALFIGEAAGNTLVTRLSHSGDHLIEVFQGRDPAWRGERVSYTLTISITGGVASHGTPAATPRGLQETAGRAAEGRFDATGSIPCARHLGQPMGQCAFGVARAAGGTATVAVTHPDGRRRVIFFEHGHATGANISQADGDVRLTAHREADLNFIRIGSERYEIPDAAILGG